VTRSLKPITTKAVHDDDNDPSHRFRRRRQARAGRIGRHRFWIVRTTCGQFRSQATSFGRANVGQKPDRLKGQRRALEDNESNGLIRPIEHPVSSAGREHQSCRESNLVPRRHCARQCLLLEREQSIDHDTDNNPSMHIRQQT